MRAPGAYADASKGRMVAPLIFVRVLDVPLIATPETTYSYYFTDSDKTTAFFDENGTAQDYLPVGMEFDVVGADQTQEVKSVQLRIDNVSREFCSLVSLVNLDGCAVQILRAFRDNLSTPLAAQTVIAGRINSWRISESEIEIEIIVPLSLEMRVPRRLFWPRCNWQFKSVECGYFGTVGTTDLASSGNAISGGDNSSYVKGNAFDDNESTYWESTQAYTAILGAAYIGQSGLTSKPRKVRLKTYSSTNNNIASIKAQYRNAGGEWTDIVEWTIPKTVSTWNELTLPNYGATGTFDLRLLANDNLASGYRWRVFEIQFLNAGTVETTCDHTLATCKAYGNERWFGGFPHLLKSRDPRLVWTKT